MDEDDFSEIIDEENFLDIIQEIQEGKTPGHLQ